MSEPAVSFKIANKRGIVGEGGGGGGGGDTQYTRAEGLESIIMRQRGGRTCFLFNDALNTFYLLLYGVRLVKDHLDSERGNPLPPHRLLFQGFLYIYMNHQKDRIVHTTRPLLHQSLSTGWNEKYLIVSSFNAYACRGLLIAGLDWI